MRRCSNTACLETNPQRISNFYKHSGSKDGRKARCIACCKAVGKKFRVENREVWLKRAKERQKRYTAKNPDYAINKKLKDRYGIDLKIKEQMLKNQLGLCAVCKEEMAVKSACVDHDHETGKIRNLLCIQCNWAEGHVRGCVERAFALYQYLLKWKND